MDLEVNRLERMGFEFTHSKNGTVIPPKTTDVAYQKEQGVADITYKKRDDGVSDRNKGEVVAAPAKMSLELPQAKSYEASDLFGKNDSLNMTYASVQGKKASMDGVLQEIIEKNNKQAVLSDKIEEKNKEAAGLDEEVSNLEYKATMNESRSNLPGIVAGAAGAIGMKSLAVGVGALIGVPAVVTTAAIGFCVALLAKAVVYEVLEWQTGRPKLQAAGKKFESDKMKAEVQTMKDEQSRISTEISVDQNKFSMLSQSYSVFVSIMQTIIGAFNDAKRAITGNMR